MGSDQSKQSDDENSGSRRRNARRPQPPPTTRLSPPQARPNPAYQQAQANYRPAPTQANGTAQSRPERAPQQYNFPAIPPPVRPKSNNIQEHLPTTVSSPLYPRLDHVIHNYPSQSPSQLNRQEAPQKATHGAATPHVNQRSAADLKPSAPKPTYTITTVEQARTTGNEGSGPIAQGGAISPVAQSKVGSGDPTHQMSVPSAYRAAYTSPVAQLTAADASAGSTVAQKPAYDGVPSPNSLSDEGFVLINSPESRQPEVVAMPTAPQLGFKNKPKAARRPRSASRGPALNINCPTCDEQYTENIFQCGDGHSACETCKQQGVRCRLCRLPITDVRNFSLQEYVCEIRTPCYNASEGCMLSFKIGDMERHLKVCPFQELDCPMKAIHGRCSWRGKMSHLVSHFDTSHPENRQGNVDQEMLLPNIYYNDRCVHLVDIGCYKFLAQICVSEAQRRVLITVQLIGTKSGASKWIYDVHVYNKREPRRKYQFSDVCHAIGTSTEEIFREANCAVLPLPLAMTYLNEGALMYKFYIRKECEGKEFNPRAQTRTKNWRVNKNKNSN